MLQMGFVFVVRLVQSLFVYCIIGLKNVRFEQDDPFHKHNSVKLKMNSLVSFKLVA